MNLNPLKGRRFIKGKTQWQLSHETGIAQSRISLIENNLSQPSKKEMVLLSEALGYSPEEIWSPSEGN